MKRAFAGVLVVLAALFLAGGATHAAGPPVLLDHTLTGLAQGDATQTADYTLHVENPGNLPLEELTLAMVPLPPLFAERTTVNLGYLAPHEKRDVFVQVVIPVRLQEEHVSRAPLFWAGTYLDAEGKTAEFSAKSRPGGTK